MKTKNFEKDIVRVLQNGNWMIRADNNGISPSKEANGFKWNEIGEWTEAKDWDPSDECGNGLHGQNSEFGGYIKGNRVVFCEYDPSDKVNLENKIKVRRSRILMVGLPDNLSVGGLLDLSGTQITSLPDNLSVGGSLDLSGTQITSLPDNLSVGGSLYLSGTQITSLPDNLSVGGSLYLSGTQISSLPDNLSVGGSLDLSGTQITNIPERFKNKVF